MKLVGERRALAAAVLFFYALLLGLNVLLGGVPPEMRAAIGAVAAVYGLAFFALVAGYFWARWFAIGVALFGVITSAVGIWQLGPEETLLFFGGTHLAAVLFLWGEAMAAPFDGQTAWRERFHIDDNARHRLGKAVIRAGLSLPMVILYGLAPRAGGTLATVALVFGVAGVAGIIKRRAWSVLALGAGAVVCAIGAIEPHAAISLFGVDGGGLPAAAAIGLAGAAVPFLRPAMRSLTAR
jgi:hypothetical protein